MTAYSGEVYKHYGWPLACCTGTRNFRFDTMQAPAKAEVDLLVQVQRMDAGFSNDMSVDHYFGSPWHYTWNLGQFAVNAIAIIILSFVSGLLVQKLLLYPTSARVRDEREEKAGGDS